MQIAVATPSGGPRAPPGPEMISTVSRPPLVSSFFHPSMPNTTHHVSDPPPQERSAPLPELAGETESNVVALRLQGRASASTSAPNQLVTIPGLFAEPFWKPTGPTLGAADQRWFAELTTRWLHNGCPADLRVSFGLYEALKFLGLPKDASPLEPVRASLQRLRCCTVVSRTRRRQEPEEAVVWGLVDRASVAGTAGWADLSREVAEHLQRGTVVHLDASTWDRLRERDELAARLWGFLETQEMPTLGRRYELFSAPLQGSARRRSLPALAEMTGIDDDVLRRQAVERVRRAAAILVELDSRYAAEVVRTGPPGMWRLEVRRRRFHAPHWES